MMAAGAMPQGVPGMMPAGGFPQAIPAGFGAPPPGPPMGGYMGAPMGSAPPMQRGGYGDRGYGECSSSKPAKAAAQHHAR